MIQDELLAIINSVGQSVLCLPPILLLFISTGRWTSLIIECNEIDSLKGFLYCKYLTIYNSVYMSLFDFECDGFLYIINGSHFWIFFFFLGKFGFTEKWRRCRDFSYTFWLYKCRASSISNNPNQNSILVAIDEPTLTSHNH